MVLPSKKKTLSTLVNGSRRTVARKGAKVRSAVRSKAVFTLKSPTQPVGRPWPNRFLRAWDHEGDSGWGDMFKNVLKERGWRGVSHPCSLTEDTRGWCLREFEAMLQGKTIEQCFGKRGAVQDGQRLKTRKLKPHFLMMLGLSPYYAPGTYNDKVIQDRQDFERLIAKHSLKLPGNPTEDYKAVFFPGINTALRKDRFSEYFKNAPWHPRAYILPDERNLLLKRMKDKPREHWICKPANECCGAGITVFAATDPMLNAHVRKSIGQKVSIVQNYVANPALLGGYKFHMRVHMVITSLDPPVAFVQSGGQCLCSTKLYSVEKDTLGAKFDAPRHISNTGLNLEPAQKDGFLKNKAVIGKGQQISISDMESYYAKHDPRFSREDLWNQIANIAKDWVKYIAQAPSVKKHNRIVRGGLFFDILGMDLLLDDNYKVWCCETNASPGLSDQDKRVHGHPNPDFHKENLALTKVWHDLFTLLGMDAEAKKHKRGTLDGWYQLDFSR